ncbi:glycosyltransferase family 2 protein [Bacillus sp. CDB3]|uniref:glycosyltransferase family 2 protein n=1 Tax=Bacillus sp. CDB3 TaxID=360310 RepID=UPI0009D87B13|nr:glycosyltransferase family 2 protein [Bacillus sp. CDB3]OQR53507.1 hypothetical protein CDB3_29245 [Bacillus sp. CDB3]
MNLNYISTRLIYNIDFFEMSYKRLVAMNTDNHSLLNKIKKRLLLLKRIHKYSEEINELFSELDSNTASELKHLSDIHFLKILESFLVTKKVKISVNIMTLNEERCIERCIKSIQNLADEIIILDTGSTDKTLEIIQHHFPHVKIHHLEWNNNFSECRNYLINHSTGDWIFQIDADEHLANNQEYLRDFLEVLNEFPIYPLVICPKIRNHDNQELDFNKRIFRKKDNLKYFGLIHEDLRYDILKQGNDLIYFTTDFLIEHDGYKPEIRASKKKCQRNLNLQHKMICIEPNNMRWFYFLAREKKLAGCPNEEVVHILLQGIENIENTKANNHFYLMSLLMLADIYHTQHNFESLNRIANEISNNFQRCIDGIYYNLISNWTYQSSQISKLINETFQNIKANESPFSKINSNGDHIFYLLGMLYINQGNYEKSFQMFSTVKDETILNRIKSNLTLLRDDIDKFLVK